MYGTIARFRMKPGMEQRFEEFSRQEVPQLPGFVFQHVYRMDADPNEYYLVVAFESREAYQANATSPKQHERYQQYSELMDSEPEWHDGEIMFSSPPEVEGHRAL